MKKNTHFVLLLVSFCILTDGIESQNFEDKNCSLTFINCRKDDAYPIRKWYFSIENNNEEEKAIVLSSLKAKKTKYPDLKCDFENCDEKQKEVLESMFQTDKPRNDSISATKSVGMGNLLIFDLMQKNDTELSDSKKFGNYNEMKMQVTSEYNPTWKKFPEGMFQTDKQRKDSTSATESMEMENILIFKMMQKNDTELSDSDKVGNYNETKMQDEYKPKWEEFPEGKLRALMKEGVKRKNMTRVKRSHKCEIIGEINHSFIHCKKYHERHHECHQRCRHGYGIAHDKKKHKAKFICEHGKWRHHHLRDCKQKFSCDVRLKKAGELHCSQKHYEKPVTCKIRCAGHKHWKNIECHEHMKKHLPHCVHLKD